MFTLQIEDDEGHQTEIPFGDTGITIGRSKENGARLEQRNVSRRHARLDAASGAVFIEDLDSYNGIRVNGEKVVGKRPIYLGDHIQLGDYSLQIQGEGLRQRSEEVTQKTSVPKSSASQEEVTKTEPMVVAPVGQISSAAPAPTPSPAREEHTAIIRITEIAKLGAAGGAVTLTGPSPRLYCIKGPMAGKEWPIKKSEVVIGRGEENDITIDHRSISRQHAKLIANNGRYRIMDLKSANGTLVNGETYAQIDLKSGDTIELGHVKFRLVWPGENIPDFDKGSEEESTDVRNKRAGRSGIYLAITAGVLMTGIGLFVILALPSKPIAPGHATALPEPPPAAVAPSNDPAPATPAPPTELPKPVENVSGFVARAKTQMAHEQWDDAVNTIEAGLAAHPNDSQLKALAETAALERGAKATFDAALAAATRGEYATARDLLGQIAEVSSYHQRAVHKLSEIEAKIPPPAKHAANSRPTRGHSSTSDDRETATTERPAEKPSVPAGGTAREQAQKLSKQGAQALLAKHYQEAIELFQQAIKTDPTYATAHRSLAIAYADTNDSEGAIAQYKAYLKLNPNAPDAEQVQSIINDGEK